MSDKLKKLEKELKYLVKSEREKEIELYKNELTKEKIDVRKLADQIYLQRGIDTSKLNRNSIIDDLVNLPNLFKDKDKQTKKKIIVDIIYSLFIIILLKLPFDLINEIIHNYLEVLSKNSTLDKICNISILLIYTIVLVCTIILMIRNFIKKYSK